MNNTTQHHPIREITLFKDTPKEKVVLANDQKRLEIHIRGKRPSYVCISQPQVRERIVPMSDLARKSKLLRFPFIGEESTEIFNQIRPITRNQAEKILLLPQVKKHLDRAEMALFRSKLNQATLPNHIEEAFSSIQDGRLASAVNRGVNLPDYLSPIYGHEVPISTRTKEEVYTLCLDLALNNPPYWGEEVAEEVFREELETLPEWMEFLYEGARLGRVKAAGDNDPWLIVGPSMRAYWKPNHPSQMGGFGVSSGQRRYYEKEGRKVFFQAIINRKEDFYNPITPETYELYAEKWAKAAMDWFFKPVPMPIEAAADYNGDPSVQDLINDAAKAVAQ